jgi:CubicO group peptidase (beta-lactamase class C family)
VSVLSALALVSVAARAAQTLPRSAPEAQGVESARILKFIEEADQQVNSIHSFMLVRHGHVVAEGWWAPYAADEQHVMFSLSKSFTSTAVGLALAEGKLSLDDPILKFFPDLAPAEPSKNLQAMRVRDLLRMQSGQHEEALRAFSFRSDENLVKKFLSLPVEHKPGTHFVYNTPGSYILSAIVQKATGQTALDYLRPRVLEPIGIEDAVWDKSAQGISYGGFGLHLRTEDIARFGQLYLQKGEWNGRQLVPAEWVAEATKLQTSNGSSPNSDWDQGYGYQFWRCRPGFYRGDGAHGQFCIVMPQYDAVVAITSGTKDMQLVMNLVWDNILPAFHVVPIAANPEGEAKLKERLAHLAIPTQDGAATSPQAKAIAGKRYVFSENRPKLEAIKFAPAGENGEQAITLKIAGKDQKIVAGQGAWEKGTMTFNDGPEKIAASGAWTADDTYTLKVLRYEGPFATQYRLHFAGDTVTVDAEQNVGGGPTPPPTLVGTAE